MPGSIEFLLGLIDRDEPPCVAWEDWEGGHGPMLRLWQEMGLIANFPEQNPVASCPDCEDGVPYRLGDRLLCNWCLGTVDPRHLLLWRLDSAAFLRWVGGQWRLRGEVRQIDGRLWQLGTLEATGGVYECFYRRAGPLSEAGRNRIEAFRQAVVLYGATPPDRGEGVDRPQLSLLELLRPGPPMALADPEALLRPRGRVRFDAGSGVLWTGETWFGEVPVGSKEFFLLDALARNLDRFVPYQDLKEYVLRAAGSADSTEEATFCQRLKNRIKRAWVPQIDRLIATTNKGDGYRLRGYVGP